MKSKWSEPWTIEQAARLLKAKKISPVELVRMQIESIERLQPAVNAFITVTSDQALAQARKAERELGRGHYRGPLHGIPITLKDLIYTRGIRTTGGSKILRDFVPAEDASVVERLRAAGAIFLGKTNLHEFAYGATNINPHYGPARNPWDLERITGGSSGGSAAAVALGLGFASLGTDTGGSIRIPSAACGVVGLKPTYGQVPVHGVIPLAATLDHVGPLCRSVNDAALMLQVIAGADPRDATSFTDPRGSFTRDLRRGARGLRIGIPKEYFFERLQPSIRKRVLDAILVLEGLGAKIREVRLYSMEQTSRLAAQITVSEALEFHWDWFRKRSEEYGGDLRTRMEEARTLTAVDYLRAQRDRAAYSRAFHGSMEAVDVLAVPTLPFAAPRLDESEVAIGRSKENVRLALLRLTRPANLTGSPAISVPCGFTSEGMPAGLQLIGKPRQEATLLRAAQAYEEATSWHEQKPPLATRIVGA